MSLPYNLFVALFLENLILDPILIYDSQDESRMGYVAHEEAKVERRITRAIAVGDIAWLRPNSGQPVTIGGHSISVMFHDERGSGYRVWEWHGHIMTYDEMDGYSLEYIHGNYFERMPDILQ